MTPLSLRVPANGLTHHVLEWPAAEPRATVLLIHGFMDAAGSWDLVAPALTEAGLRVLAPDLRGFGDGARVPAGGYYYFPDYVFDVADLVESLVPAGTPLVVVGHSMGGNVASIYTSTFPDRVARLVVIEGVGPPDGGAAAAPERMRAWMDGVRALRSRPLRSMPSREDAMRRLTINHSRVDPETMRTRFDSLARVLPDGRVEWKADPMHNTRSPTPFYVESFKAFARQVRCPVLFVSGGPLGWHPQDEDERVACFADVRKAEIDDGGHMMHWTRPAELARRIVEFAAPVGG